MILLNFLSTCILFGCVTYLFKSNMRFLKRLRTKDAVLFEISQKTTNYEVMKLVEKGITAGWTKKQHDELHKEVSEVVKIVLEQKAIHLDRPSSGTLH